MDMESDWHTPNPLLPSSSAIYYHRVAIYLSHAQFLLPSIWLSQASLAIGYYQCVKEVGNIWLHWCVGEGDTTNRNSTS